MIHTKVHTIRAVNFKIINYIHIGIDFDTRKAFVVDPAWDFHAIKEYLDKEELSLEMVLLTHSHIDHVDLANEVAEYYNVPVYISRTEVEYYHFSCKNLILLEDMQELSIGTKKITCIQTPGHTKGSICYLFDSYLFTGDTLFIEGCGICNTVGGSAYDMFSSVQRLKNMISEDTLVYPGHCFKESVGVPFRRLLTCNIYFGFDNPKDFAQFRNRSSFKGAFRFV